MKPPSRYPAKRRFSSACVQHANVLPPGNHTVEHINVK